jgi:hypothetical protein
MLLDAYDLKLRKNIVKNKKKSIVSYLPKLYKELL